MREYQQANSIRAKHLIPFPWSPSTDYQTHAQGSIPSSYTDGCENICDRILQVDLIVLGGDYVSLMVLVIVFQIKNWFFVFLFYFGNAVQKLCVYFYAVFLHFRFLPSFQCLPRGYKDILWAEFYIIFPLLPASIHCKISNYIFMFPSCISVSSLLLSVFQKSYKNTCKIMNRILHNLLFTLIQCIICSYIFTFSPWCSLSSLMLKLNVMSLLLSIKINVGVWSEFYISFPSLQFSVTFVHIYLRCLSERDFPYNTPSNFYIFSSTPHIPFHSNAKLNSTFFSISYKLIYTYDLK